MKHQLTLDGKEVGGLTLRQSLAFKHVQDAGPVAADEIGALLHSAREKHRVDERCDWCAIDGRQVLVALRKKGLVRERRGAGWISVDDAPTERESAQTGVIPF